jgi:uncharacterized protein (DUF427 family)
MTKALWNDAVVAESGDCVVVDGYHYFPRAAVRPEHLRESTHHTVCGWKGTASYYDVVVGDAVNPNAAWYYPDPSKAAAMVADRIAFWKGVKIQS